MIIFAFILYILFVVLLGASALLYLSPILIGLFTIIVGNAVSKIRRGKMAPILWHIITVAITVVATGMLWKDIFDEAVDTGPIPFIILGIYGLVSLIIFSIPGMIEKKEYRQVLSWDELPEKTQKRIRISRVVAIACTVMAGIGALIVVTGSSDISESLPPTVLFAVVALTCWIIANKKHYANNYTAADGPYVDPTPSIQEENQRWNEDLRKGLKKGPAGKEYDWKLKETWEDYPGPDYDAIHTYCEVAFDDSGRTYYYRTRNPELQVGDTVYVPFGYKAPKKIGVIVSMEDYVGHEAPFPLEKTKFIIGKV